MKSTKGRVIAICTTTILKH